MYTIYGIKNCDTMKKALAYLDTHQIEYTFFDYKKQSPSLADFERWQTGFGELPVNTRGTTYRKMKAEYERGDKNKKIQLLQENLSALKRPILEGNGILLRGFKADEWPKE